MLKIGLSISMYYLIIFVRGTFLIKYFVFELHKIFVNFQRSLSKLNFPDDL
jgi:hypothetical protein